MGDPRTSRPRIDSQPCADQITSFADGAGHDKRYAIDAIRIGNEFGWRTTETFESDIEKTVRWYLDNQD